MRARSSGIGIKVLLGHHYTIVYTATLVTFSEGNQYGLILASIEYRTQLWYCKVLDLVELFNYKWYAMPMPVPCHIGIIQPCMVIIDGIDPYPVPALVTSNDVDVNDMSIRTQIK